MELKKQIKSKGFYLAASLAALILTTIVVTGVSSANGFGQGYMMRGQNTTNGVIQNKGAWSQHRQVMDEVFANGGDYNTWKTQMTEQQNEMQKTHQQMMDQITPENFSQFAHMHELMMSGDITGAQAIATQLGITMGGKGFGGGGHRGGQAGFGCPLMQGVNQPVQ
jgi:hypothetical protein